MKLAIGKQIRSEIFNLFLILKWLAVATGFGLARLVTDLLLQLNRGYKLLRVRFLELKRFNLITFLEPRRITVKEYCLCGLRREKGEHFSILEIQKWSIDHDVRLEEAIAQLDSSWQVYSEKADIIMPVYAFGKLSPAISSVESLLVRKLPTTLISQIVMLNLERPVELRVSSGQGKGTITSSIVDISINRLLILDGFDQILEELEVIGSRIAFSTLDLKRFNDRVHEMLGKNHVGPLGSKLMLGGFGAVFAFELTILFEAAMPQGFSFGEILVLIIFSLTILAYLAYQFVDESLVAFESVWTTTPYKWTMYLFLAFLVGYPFLAFIEINPFLLVAALRIYTILFIALCIVKDLGRIFFEKGLSKATLMLGWFGLLSFLIISFWL